MVPAPVKVFAGQFLAQEIPADAVGILSVFPKYNMEDPAPTLKLYAGIQIGADAKTTAEKPLSGALISALLQIMKNPEQVNDILQTIPEEGKNQTDILP